MHPGMAQLTTNMIVPRYVLILSLVLSLSARAQSVDTVRANRPLQAEPATVSSARSSARPPLTNQEMSQIVNAVGGGSHPGVMVRTLDNRYEGLRGTPYFLADWSKGQIDMANGRRYVDVPIKFDAFRQALILRRPTMSNDSIIIDRDAVSRFRLVGSEGQEYVFKRYPTVKSSDDDAGGSYFLVLYEGKTTLLKRIAKTFQGADYKQPYSPNVRYDSFENSHTYYVLRSDQKLTKVKLSKKSLLDALNDKSDAAKAFADSQKSVVKSETDAVALVQQYDSLK